MPTLETSKAGSVESTSEVINTQLWVPDVHILQEIITRKLSFVQKL